MSFTTSALVLAWVAIALLALGFAGLLLQVQRLSRDRAGGPGSSGTMSTARTPRDLVGFTLPDRGLLAEFADPRAERTVVLVGTPGCTSCERTLQRLAAMPESGSATQGLTLASTGSVEPFERLLDDGSPVRLLGMAREAIDQLGVPGTPYLLVLDGPAPGRLTAALMPEEDTDVPAWVRRVPGGPRLEVRPAQPAQRSPQPAREETRP